MRLTLSDRERDGAAAAGLGCEVVPRKRMRGFQHVGEMGEMVVMMSYCRNWVSLLTSLSDFYG